MQHNCLAKITYSQGPMPKSFAKIWKRMVPILDSLIKRTTLSPKIFDTATPIWDEQFFLKLE